MSTHQSGPIGLELIRAARLQQRGDPDAAARCARALADDQAVDSAVLDTNRNALRDAALRGWPAEDVCQFATRRAKAAVGAYLVDLVADRARRAHGRGRIGALTIAIEALALLMSLPELPRADPRPSTRERPVDDKMLARVRALLAKAESTTFPDEAEALSAKAQELMTRHAFDRAVLDSTPERQFATARRIWLDDPYAGAKALLVQSVAKANRCRAMYYGSLGFVTVLGDEDDLRIVELLSTSLLVQATKAMLAKGSQTGHSGQSRTRSYRHAFLVAYATRIGERLRGVSEASMAAESEPSRLLPVLAARRKAVEELFESMFPRTVAKRMSATNVDGWTAGRAAADNAVLETRQRIGNATSQTSSAGFAAMKSVK